MQFYLIVFIALILGAITIELISKALKLKSNILFIGFFGAFTGVLIGSLIGVPLSKLPGIFGTWLPIVITIISTIGAASLFLSQKENITSFFTAFNRILGAFRPPTSQAPKSTNEILVDTSVIIDGRILDIVKTGFISAKLLVPKFVLEELQNVADSSEMLKRNRGKRGLEILDSLKKQKNVAIEVLEEDLPKERDVDSKLIQLAKKRTTDILTTDYNLNKIARFQGVSILNINELANALKTILLPGETLSIKIVQEGKGKRQGLGYLADGTMVVVEDGDQLIGEEVQVEVTKILQTAAGRMIFAKLLKRE